jgi:hypothetical protein
MVQISGTEYDWGQGWVMEQMLSRRVIADSVLLPNGKVVLLNGEHGGRERWTSHSLLAASKRA